MYIKFYNNYHTALKNEYAVIIVALVQVTILSIYNIHLQVSVC